MAFQLLENECHKLKEDDSLGTTTQHLVSVQCPEAIETSLLDATRSILGKVDLFICGLCSKLFTNYLQFESHKGSICDFAESKGGFAKDVTLEWLSRSLFASAVRQQSLNFEAFELNVDFLWERLTPEEVYKWTNAGNRILGLSNAKKALDVVCENTFGRPRTTADGDQCLDSASVISIPVIQKFEKRARKFRGQDGKFVSVNASSKIASVDKSLTSSLTFPDLPKRASSIKALNRVRRWTTEKPKLDGPGKRKPRKSLFKRTVTEDILLGVAGATTLKEAARSTSFTAFQRSNEQKHLNESKVPVHQPLSGSSSGLIIEAVDAT